MSLVVAAIHDDGISLVSDTKITHPGDPARTRRVLRFALPKLVIVDDRTVVGFAGRDPENVLRRLVEARGQEVTAILDAIRTMKQAFRRRFTWPNLPTVASAGRRGRRSNLGRSRLGG